MVAGIHEKAQELSASKQPQQLGAPAALHNQTGSLKTSLVVLYRELLFAIRLAASQPGTR